MLGIAIERKQSNSKARLFYFMFYGPADMNFLDIE